MRILQTPARFYPFIGGVENVVAELSRALVELGHEVTVVCAAEPPGSATSLDGVKVRRLSYLFKVANTNITPALPLHLLRERYDVVHTHLPTPWAADWSALLGRLRGKGVVLTYYNDIVGTGAAAAIAQAYNLVVLPVTLGAAHQIVVNSDAATSNSRSPLMRARDRIVLIPNGVDTQRLHPVDRLRIPGTIGFLALLDEFHRYKGLDVLLHAVKQLVDGGQDVKVLVGGEGSLRAEFEQTAERLGVSEHIHFQGFVPDSQLHNFFNRCEVFVLPSTDRRQEGFGLVALEAMACGVPVIVSSAAGVAGTLEQSRAAVIIPPGDATALANAIRALLASPLEAERLGRQGRSLVETQFSWHSLARIYEQVYEAACRSQ
jgi:glycosyltransferase involved in cell wall biosynthesis